MKNIVSLLAVAAFALVFGAACGKHTECDQAKVKSECVKDKFEDKKFNCKWTPNAEVKDAEKDGKCEVDKAKDADAEKKAKRAEAQKECAKGAAADCASKTAEAEKKDASAKCEMSTDPTPVCKAVDNK